MKAIKSVFLIGALVLASCSQHHCRLRKDGQVMGGGAASNKTSESTILVAKPDGSLQCQENSGISLEKMAKDLGRLQILKQFKVNDGMMRIQVCGAPTGMYNVYEISESDLKMATDVGFEVWKGPKN